MADDRQSCIAVSYGEIALKKDNRRFFEERLIKNIKGRLVGLSASLRREQSKIYIYASDLDEVARRMEKVFGIVYIARQLEAEKTAQSIAEAALQTVREELLRAPFVTFKVESKRSDKAFSMTSPEISRFVGGRILSQFPELVVDVHHPDRVVRIDVKAKGYVSIARTRALGGMPVGVSGKALSLLSGGIDSPVASILAMKRGLEVDFVHFHSHPFTSRRAFEKTRDLALLAAQYEHSAKLYSANLLPYQEAIGRHCDERFTTILQRRGMLRICEKIAAFDGRIALVTGENLGQVASQTLEGMAVTDRASDLLILRPLVAYDKSEIVELARSFGTFETSILPYEDCCTVFVAKHPKTRPTLEQVLAEEEKLDVAALVEEVYQSLEMETLKA